MSGTLMSMYCSCWSSRRQTVQGAARSASSPYLAMASATTRRLDHAVVGQRLQRGHGDVVAVDLEEAAQVGAVVAAAEAVGAEHGVARIGTNARIWSAKARM